MILSDRAIHDWLGNGLEISPFEPEEQIQPASIDLRLGEEVLNLRHRNNYAEQNSDEITFDPACHGNFYLGHTLEEIRVPRRIGASMWGRSSVARKGLIIHTAGWVDPGFEGELVLEIANFTNEPVTLPVGQRVCQLVFHQMDQHPRQDYGQKDDSKYQNQTGVTESRLEQHGN